MKEETFREKFDKAARDTVETPRNKLLARVLECLQGAVQEMQDNGYPLTLALRLRDDRAQDLPRDDKRQVTANGSIAFGENAPVVQFVCVQQSSDTLYLKAFIGTQEVFSQYAYGENFAHMSQGLLRGLMTVQAEHEMVSKFTLDDPHGKTAKLGKGVLPKPPQ